MAEKQAPHVEQALAESASGNDDQKKAAQKRLDAAGYVRAAKARAGNAGNADGEDEGEDKASRAPQGRRAPGRQQA